MLTENGETGIADGRTSRPGSLGTCTPTLKLGFVLVPAAALLEAARPDGLAVYVVRDQLELGPGEFGLLGLAAAVGSLAVVAAAVQVDRHIPHAMMSRAE